MATTTIFMKFYSVFVLVCLSGYWHGADGEETCRQANAWPPHRPDADVRFGLLLSKNFNSLKEDASLNCEMTSSALQHYLTVEWLVDKMNRVNNGTGYLPGMTIGFDGLNDCSMPEYAARNSVSLSNKYLPYSASQCTQQEGNATHAGLIMVSTSNVARKVAATNTDLPVPLISATATLPELSDRQLYPNFFRTIPSDDHQIDLIVNILERLSWTYVVVVYQDTLYGNSGLGLLKQKALEKHICIHKALKLPGVSYEIAKEFDQIVDTAKDKKIAVVVIADIQQTQQLLCFLEQSPPKQYHFIMTEAVNKHDFSECAKSSWTFTISTDAEVEMEDLKAYMNMKYQNVRSNMEAHPVIAEYLKGDSAPKVGALVETKIAPFITSTINAVFALVEAVRILHETSCQGLPGKCDAMDLRLKEAKLLEVLGSNSVDYGNIDPQVLPEGLQKSKATFTFNADTGNILPQRNLHEYVVCYLHNQQHITIGSYTNGQMQLNVSEAERISTGTIPTSVCFGKSCDTCVDNNKVPIVFLEGDVYIVGVLSIHEANLFNCGAWRKTGNDAFVAEGFIYAVKSLREKTNIRFGAIGIDDCYSPLRIMSLLTDYLSNINPSNSDLFSFHVPREKIVGAIGCRSSGCTLATASVFMPQKIPLISYGASSPDLDDRVNYPYFLRTVPSDVYQAQVMVDIIKQMGWEYVGLLYVMNNYGTKGMMAFRDIVDQEGSGICVPPEFGISEENNKPVDNDAFFNAYIHLRTHQVKVVVFFGIDERFSSFLEIMEKNNRHGNFIFLASEEWGNNKVILNAGVKSARGSITLKLQEVGVESQSSFKQYLKTKKPSKDDVNIWYREFWQNFFSCSFRGSLINDYYRECDSSLKLNDVQVDELVKEQRLSHVMNAVFAMGNGFKSIKDNKCEGTFPCDYLTENPNGTVEEIRKQKINFMQQSRDVFDEHRNGAIGFDVFNIQSSNGGSSYEYNQVGTFFGNPETDELDVDKLKFYDDSGNTISVTAKCSGALCGQCKHKSSPSPPVTPKPTTEEQSGTDYKDSEILIISLIIVLIIAIAVTVATLILCFRRRCKDIEKKIAVNPDQIYAEPDHRVYPGPYNRTMPVFSDPNFSPYQDSSYNRSGDGLHNPGYSSGSEHVDSISQIDAPRRQTHTDANIGGHLTGVDGSVSGYQNQKDQWQPPAAAPVPHYTGRPLPSSVIGRSNTYIESDRLPSGNSSGSSQPYVSRGAHGDLSHSSNHTVSPSHISLASTSVGTYDPSANGAITAVSYSSAPETTARNMPAGKPIIYFIRNSKGELTQHHVQSGAQMSPALSHTPYMQQQITTAVPFHTMISTNGGTQHEMVELRNMYVPQSNSHFHHSSHSQAPSVSETPLAKNSPIHYASPVHAPVQGDTGEAAIVHQPPNTPHPHQDPVPGLPMGDPKMNAVNHFQEASNPLSEQDLPALRGDKTSPSDKFQTNVTGHVDLSDLEREEINRYLAHVARAPDVISSGQPQPVARYSAGASDRGADKELETPDDHNREIKFHQPANGQLPVSEANTAAISNV